jgi:hypothetical protein
LLGSSEVEVVSEVAIQWPNKGERMELNSTLNTAPDDRRHPGVAA